MLDTVGQFHARGEGRRCFQPVEHLGASPSARSSVSLRALPHRRCRPARGSRRNCASVRQPSPSSHSAMGRAGGSSSTESLSILRAKRSIFSDVPPPARACSHAACAVGAQPMSAENPMVCAVSRMRDRSRRTPPNRRRLADTSISTDSSSASITFGENWSSAIATRRSASVSLSGTRSSIRVWGATVCTPPRRMFIRTPADAAREVAA